MLFSLFLPTGPDGNPVAGTSGAVNVVTVPVSVAASNGGTPPQVGLINRKKYEKYEWDRGRKNKKPLNTKYEYILTST